MNKALYDAVVSFTKLPSVPPVTVILVRSITSISSLNKKEIFAVPPAVRLLLLVDIATVGASPSGTGATKSSKSSCAKDGTVVLPATLTILLLKSVPVPAPFINTYRGIILNSGNSATNARAKGKGIGF